MHELALTEDVLAHALVAARQAGARSITQITLSVASTSHAEPEVIRTHFHVISRGTLAEDADLRIITRPVSHLCPHCGRSYVVTDDWACPACGAPALLEQDEPEMKLEDVEVYIAEAG
jgi:hydrogenase nickel incorporation protein HypA/HybF